MASQCVLSCAAIAHVESAKTAVVYLKKQQRKEIETKMN